MNARIDPELAAAGGAPTGTAAALAPPPPLPVALDADVEIGNQLPADHPPWSKDTLSLSARARALLSRIRPVVLRVIGFWDHRFRSIVVGGRTLSVDASGSYRLD